MPLRSQLAEIPGQWHLESQCDLHWETLSGVQVLSEVSLINYTDDIFTLACDLDTVPRDKRVWLQSLLSCSCRKDCEKWDCVVPSSVLFSLRHLSPAVSLGWMRATPRQSLQVLGWIFIRLGCVVVGGWRYIALREIRKSMRSLPPRSPLVSHGGLIQCNAIYFSCIRLHRPKSQTRPG